MSFAPTTEPRPYLSFALADFDGEKIRAAADRYRDIPVRDLMAKMAIPEPAPNETRSEALERLTDPLSALVCAARYLNTRKQAAE